MRYEKIILGRIRCEKAPQVVPAWLILVTNTANLRTFWCTFTRLDNEVVFQNLQVSAMIEKEYALNCLPSPGEKR